MKEYIIKKLPVMIIVAAAFSLCACEKKPDKVEESAEISITQEVTTEGDTKQTVETEKNTEKDDFQASIKKSAYWELTDTLDEINTNIRHEAAGNDLTSIKVAAHLLNWAVGTSLETDEIKQKTEEWLSGKEKTEAEEFAGKFALVYEAYQKLLGPDAVKLLEEAGCEDAAYPWSDSPIEKIEVINDCVAE